MPEFSHTHETEDCFTSQLLMNFIVWNSNKSSWTNKKINTVCHFPTFWSLDIAERRGLVARDTTLMARIPSSLKAAFAASIKDASRKPWGGQLISKLVDTIPQHHTGMEHCHLVPLVIKKLAYTKRIGWQKTLKGHFIQPRAATMKLWELLKLIRPVPWKICIEFCVVMRL